MDEAPTPVAELQRFCDTVGRRAADAGLTAEALGFLLDDKGDAHDTHGADPDTSPPAA